MDAHGLLAMPCDQRRIIVVTTDTPAVPSINRRAVRPLSEPLVSVAIAMAGGVLQALINESKQMRRQTRGCSQYRRQMRLSCIFLSDTPGRTSCTLVTR